MHTLLQDLRYSLRQLARNPGFALTAVLSLALGIGATTAVFSVIYAALINPYPYPDADRIVRLTMISPSGPGEWGNLNGVLRIVFGSTVMSVGGGIILGLLLSVAMHSVMSRWIEGSPRDPVILAAGVVVLAVTATVASMIPARRAAAVDPMAALRSE